MKPTTNIFWIVGTFLIIVGFVYAIWVEWTEWAGIPAILALGVMCFMIAFYLGMVDRKYGLGPNDDDEGEINNYAGTYGVFAPWSWWPLGLGVSCALVFVGLAVGWWVFIFGAVMSIYFVIGWVYEFSRGKYAH